MTEKEQFVRDVINNYQINSKSKKGPIAIAVLIAILTEAVKFISSKCLANTFQTYYINKALKKGALIVQQTYEGDKDFYKEYCDDDLTQSIINVKNSLTRQEIKDILQ